MPPVAVYDIRVQPEFNDLIVGTHGRDVWVLDDLTPVQQLPQAEKAGDALQTAHGLPVSPALQRRLRRVHELFGRQSAERRDHQLLPGCAAEEESDAAASRFTGKVVRSILRTKSTADVSNVPNKAGIDRMEWDLHEAGPTPWNGAGARSFADRAPARWSYRGFTPCDCSSMARRFHKRWR